MLAFFLALSLIPSAFTASTACPNSGEDTTCLDFVHLWQPEVGSAGSWLIKSLDVNSLVLASSHSLLNPLKLEADWTPGVFPFRLSPCSLLPHPFPFSFAAAPQAAS